MIQNAHELLHLLVGIEVSMNVPEYLARSVAYRTRIGKYVDTARQHQFMVECAREGLASN